MPDIAAAEGMYPELHAPPLNVYPGTVDLPPKGTRVHRPGNQQFNPGNPDNGQPKKSRPKAAF